MIRALLGNSRRRLQALAYRRLAILKCDVPIVTFTFDDFPKNAATSGAAIVEAFGGRATYYTAMGLCGIENRLGTQFDLEDLFSLAERGHEIGNHTFSHLSARRCRFAELLNDVHECEAAFQSARIPAWTRNFAYPYGEVSLLSKGRLGSALDSCRGTQPGWNGPEVDLNLLRANALYGGIERGQTACDLLRENARRKGWLIFYTHDVCDMPSPYGCTPELLERVARCAAECGHHSMPVGRVVNTVLA
jgi:peptidoglycan/xylan/chitin deacetylase (PgdA/CDA1 family)